MSEKLNKIINAFIKLCYLWQEKSSFDKLLAGDKLRPELHLKQPRFTYSACELFTKRRERIKKFRETGNLKHLYINELDKACFSHDAAYSDSKDLAKKTVSDKILKDRAYQEVRSRNYDGYQRTVASMVYKFLIRKQDRE